MRRSTALSSLLALLLPCLVIIIPGSAVSGQAGPYLGQDPPGQVASVFAPGLVSVTGDYEYALSMSPDGDTILFTRQTAAGQVRVWQTRRHETGWSTPAPLDLTAERCKDEMEAFFSPDGQRLYFAPYNEGMDVRIWATERQPGQGDQKDSWARSRPLAGSPATDPAFFPTISRAGRLYYTNLKTRSLWVAEQDGQGAWQGRPLGLEFGGHGFIAPDESFILLDGTHEGGLGQGDIWVAFNHGPEGWSTPVNLGPRVNSAHGESCPSLSPDGRCLFFSRYDEVGGVSQIYWVDARVIETARQVAAQGEPARIRRIVEDSIAWALTRDRPLLESIISHDEDYFSFHPEGLAGVRGYQQFQEGFALWMDPRFQATRTEVRDFRCRLSRAGDVAWWSAILDDCYTWDGAPGCWSDTRWTGVLEKQDGCWRIVQMHFSFAADRPENTTGEGTPDN